MPDIRAITFDLDDTLWEIGPVIRGAETRLYNWLAEHCPRVTELYSLEDMQRLRAEVADQHPELHHNLSELRRRSLAVMFESAACSTDWVEAAFERFMIMRNEVELFPGVETVLSRLARSYPLASLTNGNADLHRIGIHHHFSVTVSACDHGVAKPHRDIFLTACDRLGFAPADVLHVGDSPEHDVLGAANAGMKTAWFNRHRDEWTHPTRADYELNDLSDLLDHFGLR